MQRARIVMLSAVSLPLLALTACGEGYEPTLYQGFPYGNERTAGSGIAYVRVNLMPQKGPVVDVAIEESEPEPVVSEPEPVKEFSEKAEDVFNEMQRK